MQRKSRQWAGRTNRATMSPVYTTAPSMELIVGCSAQIGVGEPGSISVALCRDDAPAALE